MGGGRPPSPTRDGLGSPEGTPLRPLLRGQSHALAAGGAVLGLGLLLRLTPGAGAPRLGLLVYGLGTIGLFTTSALYHRRGWAPRRRALLRRLDHAMICVVIAAGYTPLAVGLLRGWLRIVLLLGVWAVAGGGVVVVVAHPLARGRRVALYGAVGTVALTASAPALIPLGPAGLRLPALVAALCVGGTLAYVRRWPPLWPRVFGYHELFHLALVAAHGVFVLFLLREVVRG